MSSKKGNPKSGEEEEALPKPSPPTEASTTPTVGTTPSSAATTTPTAATTTSATLTSVVLSERQKPMQEKKTYSDSAKGRLKLLAESKLTSAALNWDQILEMAMAAAYDQYDPVLMQMQVKKLTSSSASMITKLLLANIFFGNNADRRSKNIVDKDKAKPILDAITSAGVVKGKPSSDVLTLARIGNSHPVLLLALRKRLDKSGALQTSGVTSSCPLALADLSLAPLSDKIPAIKDHIAAFSKVLFIDAKRREKIPKEMTEEMWTSNQEKFRMLAVGAFASDPHFGKFSAEQLEKIGYEQALGLMGYT